ncbi:MAG: hypothetical protein GDA42_03255 [Ekhidna sp.]|nr:hypothetical protein [Ekhidna sp.]
MKLFFITLLILFSNDPKKIAKINSIKKEAEKAYLSGDYKLAAAKYSLLSDSLNVDEDLIKLNLGHSYFNLGDTSGAKLNYGKLGMSSDKKLKSIAYQQLGVMSKDAGKLEQSLQQLKFAIKANPANEDAIYNYEVVKKLLEERKEQQQQNQNKENQDQNENKNEEQNKNQQNQDQQNKNKEQEKKDQQNKDEKQENKDQQSQNQDQSEEDKRQKQQQEQEKEEQQQEKSQEQMTREKLKEMGISEEKALQLLEAMRQSEIKYLQNQKRKATKRPPSGKPDW